MARGGSSTPSRLQAWPKFVIGTACSRARLSNCREISSPFLSSDRQGAVVTKCGWSRGEPAAFDKLSPLVYTKLRRLARYYMAHERPGHMRRGLDDALTALAWRDWRLAKLWLLREMSVKEA